MLVIASNCVGCATCKLVCPNGAIEVVGSAEVDVEKCVECGKCVQYCPLAAIKIV